MRKRTRSVIVIGRTGSDSILVRCCFATLASPHVPYPNLSVAIIVDCSQPRTTDSSIERSLGAIKARDNSMQKSTQARLDQKLANAPS